MSDDEVLLLPAWQRAAGIGQPERALFDAIVTRYREPHRHYHTVRHLAWVVRHLGELEGDLFVDDIVLQDRRAVVAAAFFHDAVYDPTATDNEEVSARLAERELAAIGWDSSRRGRVAALVLATQGHAGSADLDTATLVDADLAVLGADPAAYQAYVNGVRAEYAHVDDAAWRTGRAAILSAFIARDHLYATAPGRRRWEERARANLAAELSTLR